LWYRFYQKGTFLNLKNNNLKTNQLLCLPKKLLIEVSLYLNTRRIKSYRNTSLYWTWWRDCYYNNYTNEIHICYFESVWNLFSKIKTALWINNSNFQKNRYPKKVLSENQQSPSRIDIGSQFILIQLWETMSYVPQLYEHVKWCFVA